MSEDKNTTDELISAYLISIHKQIEELNQFFSDVVKLYNMRKEDKNSAIELNIKEVHSE